ncbi:MAG: glycoside hydrolase family 108 protein [Hyphomicrobiales bacterium]|nr:glycoside hydrolase family 108 protein [Hyphomicrobiales bacterium]
MAAENFNACLALTLRFEGGYSDDRDDPGGATKFGVTHATLAAHRGRPVTKADVRALTRAEAAEIYRKHYWRAVRGDDLPPGLDAVVFDHAVNSGPAIALKSLARALRHKPRGAMSEAMLAACHSADGRKLARDLCARRLATLKRLKTFRTFGPGWTRRVETLEREALKMIAAAPCAAPASQRAPVALLAPPDPEPQQEKTTMLKGYRTFIVGFVVAVAPAALQYVGAVDWTKILGPTGAFFISGLVTMAMRAVTTTAPGELGAGGGK